MSVTDHLRACASFLAIAVNLLLALPALLVFLALRILFPRWGVPDRAVHAIYRACVKFDEMWLRRVLKGQWHDRSETPSSLEADRSYIVISNHVSSFDIFVVQSLVLDSGPIASFLVKRELAYFPIVGWIALALRFPLLSRANRSAQSSASRGDINAVTEACRQLNGHPAALVNFVEGTRFQESKRIRSESPYQNLLAPRVKGLKAMIEGMKNDAVGVIDISLAYHDAPGFWPRLAGHSKRLSYSLEVLPLPKSSDAEEWLHTRWAKKDAWISQVLDN